MARGGKRAKAGRSVTYTFEQKLALANEVTLLQRSMGISRVKALDLLEKQKKISPNYSVTIKRYLTPKYLNKEITRVLLKHDRTGILSLTPHLPIKKSPV